MVVVASEQEERPREGEQDPRQRACGKPEMIHQLGLLGWWVESETDDGPQCGSLHILRLVQNHPPSIFFIFLPLVDYPIATCEFGISSNCVLVGV